MKSIFTSEQVLSGCEMFDSFVLFIGYARVEISEGKFRTSGVPIARPLQECSFNNATGQYICNDTWTWEWDENQGNINLTLEIFSCQKKMT